MLTFNCVIRFSSGFAVTHRETVCGGCAQSACERSSLETSGTESGGTADLGSVSEGPVTTSTGCRYLHLFHGLQVLRNSYTLRALLFLSIALVEFTEVDEALTDQALLGGVFLFLTEGILGSDSFSQEEFYTRRLHSLITDFLALMPMKVEHREIHIYVPAFEYFYTHVIFMS